MAANTSIKVKGLRELNRDFGRINRELRRDLQKEMQNVASVVSDDAREWATRLYGPSVGNKIRPRVRGASAFAESRAQSKGLRPNFGGKVMGVLLASRAKKQDEVIRGLEDMLDGLASENGFGRGIL